MTPNRLLKLRNRIGNKWIWAYTPCYTGSQVFLVIIDEFRSTSIFDHPPLFMKSGLVLPLDDSLAVSAALPAWIGI